MKVNHPNFQNVKEKEPSHQAMPMVHTVMPPEDEEFMKKMGEVLSPPVMPEQPVPSAAMTMDDPIIKKQLERKAVLEKLVMFKRPYLKTVTVKGINFNLKILNAEENARVYNMIRDLPEEEQLTKSPIVMLSASLVNADGVAIEDTYSGPPEITDPMTRRYYELSNWHMPLINTLMSAYREFSNSVEEEYTKDFLGKSQATTSTD